MRPSAAAADFVSSAAGRRASSWRARSPSSPRGARRGFPPHRSAQRAHRAGRSRAAPARRFPPSAVRLCARSLVRLGVEVRLEPPSRPATREGV